MTQRERQRHRPWEKQAPCGEPVARLDPKIAESPPEPNIQPLSHPGASRAHSIYHYVTLPPIFPYHSGGTRRQMDKCTSLGIFFPIFTALTVVSDACSCPTSFV